MLRKLLSALSSFAICLSAFSFSDSRFSVQATTVLDIHSAQAADIVILGAGHEAGFRQGMICRITRAGTLIGEIILTDLRLTASAALILNLENGQSIQPGDTVSVKTIG